MPQLDTSPTCPSCRKKLDGFTAVQPETRPSPGDATVCAYCGELLEFTQEMDLILITNQTRQEIDPQQLQQMEQMAELWRMLHARKLKHIHTPPEALQ